MIPIMKTQFKDKTIKRFVTVSENPNYKRIYTTYDDYTSMNTGMISKKEKSVLLATLMAAAIIPLLGMNAVNAEHPLPTDNPFDTGTATICLDLTQMSFVTVDGSMGNEQTIADAAGNAISMYNTSTIMELTHSSNETCEDGSNMIGARYLIHNAQGVEAEHGLVEGDRYSTLYLNWNKKYDTSSTCSSLNLWWPEDTNPGYILNHEMGHFAGLDHTEGWFVDNSHSLMKPNCNSGYSTLPTDDIKQINGFYTVEEEENE